MSLLSKKSVLLILVVSLTTPIFAQLQTGIKAGYAFLELTSGNPYGIDVYSNTKPSYFISLILRQRKPKCFNLSCELEYGHRYFSVDSKWGYTSYFYWFDNFDISAQYVKVVFEPQFVFGKRLKFFVGPGIYLGYMIYSMNHGKYGGHNDWDSTTYTIPVNGSAGAYLSEFEFGLIFNSGLDIPLYKGLTLLTEFAQTMTIPPLHNKWGYEKGVFIFETRFSVGIAYNFPAKKKH